MSENDKDQGNYVATSERSADAKRGESAARAADTDIPNQVCSEPVFERRPRQSAPRRQWHPGTVDLVTSAVRKAARSPDLHLKVMSKTTGQKSGRVGVGWLNRDDAGGIASITVSIDYPTVMQASDDQVWTLFPASGEHNPFSKKP